MERNTSKNKKPTSNHNRPNFWGMMRDVLISSLNKGQFPIALVGLIIVIIVLRMPEDKIGELAFRILELFREMHILGWVLSAILTLGWFFNVKALRRLHTNEVTRVSDEKKDLQGRLIGKEISSSSKKYNRK